MKRYQLSKQQKDMKRKLVSVYSKPYSFVFLPDEWHKKLFTKSTEEVHAYILDRFDNTENEIEYLTCMVFLYKTIPNVDLLVPWHDSINHERIRASYSDLADERYEHLGVNMPTDLSRDIDSSA